MWRLHRLLSMAHPKRTLCRCATGKSLVPFPATSDGNHCKERRHEIILNASNWISLVAQGSPERWEMRGGCFSEFHRNLSSVDRHLRISVETQRIPSTENQLWCESYPCAMLVVSLEMEWKQDDLVPSHSIRVLVNHYIRCLQLDVVIERFRLRHLFIWSKRLQVTSILKRTANDLHSNSREHMASFDHGKCEFHYFPHTIRSHLC